MWLLTAAEVLSKGIHTIGILNNIFNVPVVPYKIRFMDVKLYGQVSTIAAVDSCYDLPLFMCQ